MNRIKKLTLPLFAACLCAALIGCSEDKKETKSTAPTAQEQVGKEAAQAVQQPVEQAKEAAVQVEAAAKQAAEATQSTDSQKISEWLRAGNPVKTVIGEITRAQLQEIADFTRKIDELIAEGYDPKLDDGVGKNIAPLQKKGLLRCDVLNAKQLEKYLKADW